MKKSILLTFVIAVFALSTGFSQKSVVKLGIGSAFQGDLHLKYEYAIAEKHSLQLGVLWDTPDSRFRLAEYIQDAEEAEGVNFTLQGFAVLPEYRYYLGERGALNSFYVGVYGRYRYRSLSTESDFATEYDFDVKMKLRNVGFGIGCGAQWLLGEHFSIDWYIAGFGYNQFFFKTEVTVSDFDDLEQLKMDAIQFVEDLEFDQDVDIQEIKDVVIEEIQNTDEPSISTPTTPFGLLDLRVGLSIGYAF